MLSLTKIDVQLMAAEVCRRHFAELHEVPVVYFVQSGPLASIVIGPQRLPSIYLHAILNDHDVPDYVFEYILKHEVLHLMVPSREVDGRRSDHPPEFLKQEGRIAPEREAAWDWLYDVLWDRMKIDNRHECIEVRPPRRRPRLVVE